MAKRVSERATRGGDHGGVGTPHARGASGIVLGVGVDEASSISFRLRARRLVGSVTRRRGGPLAHQPSGRGPGCGGASEREIGSPNPVGGGFASGMRSGRPNSLRGKCVLKKLFKNKIGDVGCVLRWRWFLAVGVGKKQKPRHGRVGGKFHSSGTVEYHREPQC